MNIGTFNPIIAFAQSRIDTIDKIPVSPEVDGARKFELGLIITLCEGLNANERIINTLAFGVMAQATKGN